MAGISKEVGATKDDYALLVTVFMLFYAAGQFLFGRLFDMIGTRLGFALSISVWSISIALHSITHSMLSFSLVRAMLGISEAGAWPGAVKANAEWFPARERALAQGVFNAGASIGAIVSAPAIAGLYLWLGWRGTFVLVGAIGSCGYCHGCCLPRRPGQAPVGERCRAPADPGRPSRATGGGGAEGQRS